MDDNEALKWDNIDDVDCILADEIYRLLKRGEATTEQILQHKKFLFRSQFAEGCDEEVLIHYWRVFFEGKHEDRFWNVIGEKRFGCGEVAGLEASKRYAIMSGDAIKKRETMERFLKIIGMRHSQEEIFIEAEKLDEIGGQLGPIEKEIREGLGLRKSERKGKEWKVANTIDLIGVVLDAWGCGTAESFIKNKRIDKKMVRQYSVQINKNNKFWNIILGSYIDYENKKLLLSLLPRNYKKIENQVSVVQKKIWEKDEEGFINQIMNALNLKTKVNKILLSALPSSAEEFNNYFLDMTDDEEPKIKNPDLFMRRVLGTISYYSISGSELFSKRLEDVTRYLFMSNNQFRKYADVRDIERKMDMKKGGVMDNKTSVYRAFSRMVCNFSFPETIDRRYPNDIKKALKKEIDQEEDDEGQRVS